jgi:hypothetical protein
VTVDDGAGPRRIEYVVTGGGGAYLSEPLRIAIDPPAAELPDEVCSPEEEHFRCYPTRADALAYYTRWYGRRLVGYSVLALLAALAAAAGLWHWDKGGAEIDDQNVWEIALAALGGVSAVAAIGRVVGLVAARWFYKGARFTAFVLLAAAAYGGAALGAAALLGDSWDWIWKVTLIGIGTLLFPIVLIVVAYFGFASPIRQRVVLAALLVTVAALLFSDFRSAAEIVAWVGGGLAFVALVLRLFRPRRGVVPTGLFTNPYLSGAITIAAYHAPLVAALIRYDSTWALKVALVAEGAELVAIAAGLLGLIAAGGRLALLSMRKGRVDPDDAFAVLRETRGFEEALRTSDRQGDPNDKHAKRIADFLMARSGLRKWARIGLAQLGNADTPPMFKNFVRAEVVDGGKALELSCYGVTGWGAHEQPGLVPREDCVRIPLT